MSHFIDLYVSGFWVWLGITFGIVLCLQTVCSTMALIINRMLRSRNIRLQVWPTNPLMDADGDIVHPKPPAANGVTFEPRYTRSDVIHQRGDAPARK